MIVCGIPGVDIATRDPSDHLAKERLLPQAFLAGISFNEQSESSGVVFAHKPFLSPRMWVSASLFECIIDTTLSFHVDGHRSA